MFFDDVTEEKQDELIKKAALIVKKFGMELPSTIMLKTFKFTVPVGGQLGRFFLGPLIPFMGTSEDALIQTFEKTHNIQKLIDILEDEDYEIIEEENEGDNKEENKKSWWKRQFF